MDDYPELKRQLFEAVYRRIAEQGFTKNIKTQSFVKKTPYGRQVLHLAFIKHDNDFDVTADVGLRLDKLEDLVNENNKTLSARDKKATNSLGAELGNISEGKQRRWTISGPADVEQVAESIANEFLTIGIPYLEKYSSMGTAVEALSGDGPDSWLHSPLHAQRAIRALGLAYLLGRTQMFEDLASAKTEFLRARKDFGLQRFLEFRDTLKARLRQSQSQPAD